MRIERMFGLGFLCLLIAVSSLEAQTPDRSSSELGTVENDDGTWSYEVPAGFDPEARIKGRILTWRYDGQARFAREAEAIRWPRTVTETADRPVEPEDQVRDMLRIDREGRRWRVEAIDSAAWHEAVMRQNRESPEEDEPSVAKEREHEPPLRAGARYEWTPQTWTHLNCDASREVFVGPETHLWSGESRVAVTSPDPRQETAVQLNVTPATGRPWSCSGVILTQRFILTAAHCVVTSNGNTMPPTRVQICRNDISGCLGAAFIDVPDSYSGGWNPADDWAVVELTSTWTGAGFPAAKDMDLSRASDGVLDALTAVHNIGFPGFAPRCASNTTGLFFNRETEPLAATYARKLRLKIDSTGGHSGGPYYYCPKLDDNVCAAGEKGFVIGVVSGWNSAVKRVVGAKSAAFRSAAIAFIMN